VPIIITTAGFLLIIALLLGLRARLGPPVVYRVEQHVLTILDARERVLWSHDFAAALHAPAYASGQAQLVWFRDLDGDGDPEVLFVEMPPPSEERNRSQVLHCFSTKGRERWSLTPGRAVRTQAERFTNVYAIDAIAFVPAGHGVQLVLACHHRVWYPAQILIVGADGHVVREYWHSGQLIHAATATVPGLGVRVLLGGVAQARHAATLVIIDPRTAAGVSREDDPAYQLLDLPPSRGVRRLLFPRSCMNRALEAYNDVRNLTIDDAGVLVETGERLREAHIPTLLYQFTPALELGLVSPSDTFVSVHKELERTRVLDHALSTTEQNGWRAVRALTE
jgi:hypothetical protein